MNIKKKMLPMAIAGALTFGLGTGYVTTFSPAPVAYAETANTTSSFSGTGLSLVTDTTNSVLAKADIQALTEEQSKIHQNGDVAVKYDFHTYIYSDKSVTAKDKAKEIADGYSKQGENVPFIFVVNKADKSYHFVEDTRLAPYTSAAYLSTLAEKTFANGVNAEAVKEYVVRADSTIMMSVDGDYAFIGQMPINEQASREHVDIQNFADKEAVGRHSEKPENKMSEEKDSQAEEQETSGLIPAILAFALAVGTIVFFKTKKKA